MKRKASPHIQRCFCHVTRGSQQHCVSLYGCFPLDTAAKHLGSIPVLWIQKSRPLLTCLTGEVKHAKHQADTAQRGAKGILSLAFLPFCRLIERMSDIAHVPTESANDGIIKGFRCSIGCFRHHSAFVATHVLLSKAMRQSQWLHSHCSMLRTLLYRPKTMKGSESASADVPCQTQASQALQHFPNFRLHCPMNLLPLRLIIEKETSQTCAKGNAYISISVSHQVTSTENMSLSGIHVSHCNGKCIEKPQMCCIRIHKKYV